MIVLAATNRPEVLDPALLRPGRFDRRIAVQPPDKNGRVEILKIHTRSVPIDPDVDLEQIAAATPGASGADIALIVNEAALFAARRDHAAVEHGDFTDAIEKTILGTERQVLMSHADRERTAYHESGHALVGMLTPGADPVRKVSIIPRGQALGVTLSTPESDRYSYSREDLLAKIKVALGGRAAEIVVYDELTTGAESDIQNLTKIARGMVGRWGMSEAIGPLAVDGRQDGALLPGAAARLVQDAGARGRGGAPDRRRRRERGRRAAAPRAVPARCARRRATPARDARPGGRVPDRGGGTARLRSREGGAGRREPDHRTTHAMMKTARVTRSIWTHPSGLVLVTQVGPGRQACASRHSVAPVEALVRSLVSASRETPPHGRHPRAPRRDRVERVRQAHRPHRHPADGDGGSARRPASAAARGTRFAAVFTSPLSRAAETCRLAGLGEGAQRRDALLEWDYGAYEGMTTLEIRQQQPGWLLWRDGCPGGETAADVGARVDPLIGELRALDGDTAVFAHGHVLRVIAARWIGLPPESGALFALSTATLSVLGYEREIAVIRLWNDGSHLGARR